VPNFKSAIVVTSIAEEYEIIKGTKCACGGGYQVKMQSLHEDKGKYYDILHCECMKCKEQKEFIFDINSFFGKMF
jgi:tRNA A22 N-methylase